MARASARALVGCLAVGTMIVAGPGLLSPVDAGATTSAPVPVAGKSSATLNLTTQGATFVRDHAGTDGSVTFVDAANPVVVLRVSQGSLVIGTLTLGGPTQSAPQLLPSGSYTVTPTNGSGGPAGTPTTITVPAGARTSVVSTDTTRGLVTFSDNTQNVPTGGDLLSIRNTAHGGPATVTLDGKMVAKTLSVGTAVDLQTTPGAHQVQVTNSTASIGGTLTLSPDSFNALYVTTNPTTALGLVEIPTAQGYRFTASDGGVFDYGADSFAGSMGGQPLNAPVVGGVANPTGSGYWLVAADGGIFSFGGAPFLGSLGGQPLAAPIVGMAATVRSDQVGTGYLLVGRDGGVFAYNTPFYGSLAGKATSPVVGIAAGPTGSYTVIEANGTGATFGPNGESAFGPVVPHLNAPIVGVTTTPDGNGMWLVAADGGVFASGDAPFFGSAGSLALNQPITGVVSAPDGLGYWLIARDGGVFAYGDAKFFGSMGGQPLNAPVVGPVAA